MQTLKIKDLEMLLDDDDYELYKNENLRFFHNYVVIKSKTKIITLHRLIAHAPKGTVVDHINRNTLDNRKENLRVTSQMVNQYNRPSKGIHYQGGLWVAKIAYKGKRIYLGSFNNEEEAKNKYEETKRMLIWQHTM